MQIEMRNDKNCQTICKVKLSQDQASKLSNLIKDDYRMNMILDNLPAALVQMREEKGKVKKMYDRGFPVGYYDSQQDMAYVNNHVKFTVLYHRDPEKDTARIVGFEARPTSVKHTYTTWMEENPVVDTCSAFQHPLDSRSNLSPQPVKEGEEIVYTYDVEFQDSDIKWASRWDTYLQMMDQDVHWFSVINSLMILLFLTGMVAMIMIRTLRRDISQYNQLENVEEAQEESGWKLLHGDVFRAPPQKSLLAVSVGTGMQLFGMSFVTMIFAVLGFLSPANRGGLTTAMLILYAVMGSLGGYYTGRMLKLFQVSDWKANSLKTALYFPSACFIVFFILDLLVWAKKSSGAVPFGTLCALCALWFGVSVPLVFVGSLIGYKKSAADPPVRTNKIPRQIPSQPWYLHPVFTSFIGGTLPFGAVFIELSFILTSLWLHQARRTRCLRRSMEFSPSFLFPSFFS